MCGITGWVDFKKQLVQEKQTMDRMTDTLSKRGSDDSNVWGEHHVLFGHKRLAVVDIEGGRQPMACTYKGDTYTIIYNGELYNTEDLRKELRARVPSIRTYVRYRGASAQLHRMAGRLCRPSQWHIRFRCVG
nr:hypothetical protein P5658_22330 [Bacillus subtilis]